MTLSKREDTNLNGDPRYPLEFVADRIVYLGGAKDVEDDSDLYYVEVNGEPGIVARWGVDPGDSSSVAVSELYSPEGEGENSVEYEAACRAVDAGLLKGLPVKAAPEAQPWPEGLREAVEARTPFFSKRGTWTYLGKANHGGNSYALVHASDGNVFVWKLLRSSGADGKENRTWLFMASWSASGASPVLSAAALGHPLEEALARAKERGLFVHGTVHEGFKRLPDPELQKKPKADAANGWPPGLLEYIQSPESLIVQEENSNSEPGPIEFHYLGAATFDGKLLALVSSAKSTVRAIVHGDGKWYYPRGRGYCWFVDRLSPIDVGGPQFRALEEAVMRAKERGKPMKTPNSTQPWERLPDPEAEKKEAAAKSRDIEATGTKQPERKEDEAMTTKIEKVKKFTHVTVTNSADEQIHLPEGMSLAQGREWLQKIEEAEEQLISWTQTFDAYPLDGAYALRQLLAERFGTAVEEGATRQTMFGEKDVPPYMVALEVDVDQTVYVPWGHFIIPVMPGHKLKTGISYENKQLMFTLSGQIKRKFKPLMDELAEQLKERLRSQSIYRGKAFRIDFPDEAERANEAFSPFDWSPKFISTATKGDKLILSERVRELIETNIFTPVQHSEACRKLGVPLKRGILLEGKYGVGKSLTAHVLSQLCVTNGWTFIYVKRVSALEDAMRFARRYEPAVIFAEDIDATMAQRDGSDRDEMMNNILNTIDGVDMKKGEQMVILTTNFVDRINKAMLRPGRLDAVISVDPPDEGAVKELIRHYARGLVDQRSDEELAPAARLLAGQIPSVIREVVERSKLAAIRRAAKDGTESGTLAGDDLRIAAEGIMNHVALLKENEPDRRSDVEKAAGIIAAAVKPPTNGKSRDSVVDLSKVTTAS